MARPIPGLFAAGSMVGGLFYFNYPGGAGLMGAAVFGRVAGAERRSSWPPRDNAEHWEELKPMLRLLLMLVAIMAPALAAAQTKVKVGTVRATVIGGVVSAQARGYFKEAGIDVDINLIDASAGFVPLLANNELNVVEGGVSANLFNGAAQGLPIKVAFDSTSTPINHSLMLRTDLKDKIKSIGDMKGRTLAVNAPNSIALYEVTRILETGGLTLKDVDLKVIPFAQMAVAFETKAIDAGLEITPFTALLPKQGLAVAWIDSDTVVKPSPVMISGSMFNTDWAAKNRDVAQPSSPRCCAACAIIAMPITAAHGARSCCGSSSPMVLRPAPSCSTRSPGRRAIPMDTCGASRCSTSSIGTLASGSCAMSCRMERFADDSFAAEADRKLGPFKLAANESGKLAREITLTSLGRS